MVDEAVQAVGGGQGQLLLVGGETGEGAISVQYQVGQGRFDEAKVGVEGELAGEGLTV